MNPVLKDCTQDCQGGVGFALSYLGFKPAVIHSLITSDDYFCPYKQSALSDLFSKYVIYAASNCLESEYSTEAAMVLIDRAHTRITSLSRVFEYVFSQLSCPYGLVGSESSFADLQRGQLDLTRDLVVENLSMQEQMYKDHDELLAYGNKTQLFKLPIAEDLEPISMSWMSIIEKVNEANIQFNEAPIVDEQENYLMASMLDLEGSLNAAEKEFASANREYMKTFSQEALTARLIAANKQASLQEEQQEHQLAAECFDDQQVFGADEQVRRDEEKIRWVENSNPEFMKIQYQLIAEIADSIFSDLLAQLAEELSNTAPPQRNDSSLSKSGCDDSLFSEG